MANLSYNYSGEWDDVCKALRNYPTDLILKRICKEEIEFQKNAPTSEVTGTKWVEYNVFNTRTRDSKKKESVITTWNLIDLAFYAVNASNDFRGNICFVIICFFRFFSLLNLFGFKFIVLLF